MARITVSQRPTASLWGSALSGLGQGLMAAYNQGLFDKAPAPQGEITAGPPIGGLQGSDLPQGYTPFNSGFDAQAPAYNMFQPYQAPSPTVGSMLNSNYASNPFLTPSISQNPFLSSSRNPFGG